MKSNNCQSHTLPLTPPSPRIMTEPTTAAPNHNTTNNLATTSSPSNTVDLAAEMEPYFLTSAPCLFLSFVTGVLNTFVIDYYWRSRRSFVPLLYILISGVDILTAVGIAHQSITTALFTRDIISRRQHRARARSKPAATGAQQQHPRLDAISVKQE